MSTHMLRDWHQQQYEMFKHRAFDRLDTPSVKYPGANVIWSKRYRKAAAFHLRAARLLNKALK